MERGFHHPHRYHPIRHLSNLNNPELIFSMAKSRYSSFFLLDVGCWCTRLHQTLWFRIPPAIQYLDSLDPNATRLARPIISQGKPTPMDSPALKSDHPLEKMSAFAGWTDGVYLINSNSFWNCILEQSKTIKCRSILINCIILKFGTAD